MSTAAIKRKSKYAVRISKKSRSTAYGGQLIVDAMCRQFGVWEKIAKARELNALKGHASGFSPDALAAQVVFTFTSGGVSLSHLERMKHDPVMLESVGLAKSADPETVVRWLEGQTPASVAELRAINMALVQDVLKLSDAARVRNSGGTMLVVYEDHQIRAAGREFEGLRLDPDGFLVLTQYVLWAGPFLLELGVDGTEAILGDKLELMRRYRHLWQDTLSHFVADADTCSAEQMVEVRKGGFTSWDVRNLAWDEQLSRVAAELPDAAWSGKVKRIRGVSESYARIYHTLEGMPVAQAFAVARRRADNQPDAPWQYTFLTCEPGSARAPNEVFASHRTRKEGRENRIPFFSELGLHHPPCKALAANQMFYTLASIAWNALMAIKILEMPDSAQSWRMESIIQNLLQVPAAQAKHANQTILKLGVPPSVERRAWWEATLRKLVAKRKRGESLAESWTKRKRTPKKVGV
ncbi:MAG: transposase [Verrucomicrobiota bacterium]|jgi:hypothetical protein|nr:transposase [Verrucomicrobiota bacterium]